MFEGIQYEIDVVYCKQLYVYLHDNPDAKKGKPNGSLPNASECVFPRMKEGIQPYSFVKIAVSCFFSCPGELSASELKKLQRKQKKAQLKAQAKAQEEKGKAKESLMFGKQ